MKERIKIISQRDLLHRKATYQKFEMLLVDLVFKTFGYHSKFETGFGWLLNLSKLKEHEIIPYNMFEKLYNWFEKDFVLGQKVSANEWEQYWREELEINTKLLSY